MQDREMQDIALSTSKRRPVTSGDELVGVRPLHREGSPPAVVEPVTEPVDLAVWAQSHRSMISELLHVYGGILFRGFSSDGKEDLERFVKAIDLELMDYMEGATPRRSLGNNVYTSTEFPPEHTIALHNENSYVMSWPMKICFHCVVAPENRGETPIADMRQVLRRLSPSILSRFVSGDYMLVRNFRKNLGMPWQTAFRVSTKEELERYCRHARIDFEWKNENHLQTRQVRPAVARHPETGDAVWFNHIAFWHVSSLPAEIRDSLLSGYSEDGLPYNTYYGDGRRIEDEVIEEMRQAYDSELVRFPWQRGDTLLLDNMLVAHGRSPYSGPRKIVVSMGERYTRTDI